MSDKDVLLSMGFDPARVEWALKATGNRGLQPAMDFILENEGKPMPDLSSVTSASSAPAPSGGGEPMEEDDEDLEALKAVYGKQAAGGSSAGGSGAGSSAGAEAKSIKCSLCGKTFKNVDLANFHAEKSGHDQFEESTDEIKPLTEEEKKQKLAELREKLAAKRAVKAKEDAKETLANEAIRRKAGRDMNQIREEMKQKELLKEAEKKRKGMRPADAAVPSWTGRTLCTDMVAEEKLEDAKARAAVKAQIEADKKARAEKAAREKALREGKALPEQSAPAAAPAASTAPKTAGKDYPETRLQIRLASGGQPYTTTLPSDAPLREVAEFLAAQTLAVNVDTVKFSLTFPRKTFAPEDFSRSLRDLGLTPSAVLIAS
ncbi:ubiquitin-related domain-containing protein [Trametes elegans]|nr:ubiquitin-related domain-containing protein [Trametes elegans]